MADSPPIPVAVAALAMLLGSPAAADFTEYEDQPFLAPGGAEVDPLGAPIPVPYDGTSFTNAFPAGAKLVRGNLDASDVDAYQVSLGTDDLLLAALFDPASGSFFDAVLGVFSGGALPPLGVDDDGGRGFLARLGHRALASGAFQVAVSGYGDAAFDGSHDESPQALAPYDLVLAVARAGVTPAESEGNGRPVFADPIPGDGGLVSAQLAPGDVDYFAIDLEEGDRLLVSVFDLRPGSFDFARGERNDPVLGFFDPTGAPFPGGLDDDGGPGFLPNRAITVPPAGGGRWTIAVSGYGDAAFDGSHEEEPFDYFLAAVRDRACPDPPTPMSNVSVSTAEPYDLAHLEGGDHYYTDRNNPQSHVLVDVPEALECGQWIRTANDDKNVATFPHLTFTLSEPTSVYVAYDTRATAEPTWLATGFTPTGMVIDILDPDPAQEFDVLRRDFLPGTVQLGGNQAPGANSNYVVIAKPLDTSDSGQAYTLPAAIQDGQVSITISGVVIVVPTSSAQSPADVAQSLAAAVNADPTLQALRVFAVATGATLVTTGSIEDVQLGFPVPGLSPWAAAVALALLTALAARFRRSR